MRAAVPALPARAAAPAGSHARAAWVVPAAVALLAAGVTWWASAPYAVGVFHDDGVYALLARSIASGEGFRYLQLPGAPAATHYPPLYPLALAVVWWLVPSFPENVSALLALNALFIGVAALGLYHLQRRWFGWREEGAAAVSLTALLGMPILTLSTTLMSEPLFLAGLAPTLLAAQSALDRGDRRGALLAGAAIGALMLVRTLAVSLLGAVVLLFLLRRAWRSAAMVAAAALVVQLPWLVWSSLATPVVAAPLEGAYGAYAEFFRESWRSGGIGILGATARLNLRELWLLLGDRVWGELGRVAGVAMALLLLALLVAGAARVARHAPVLVVFLVSYFAIVLAMSYTPFRFAWGVWPLLVVLAAVGADAVVSASPRGALRVAASVLVALPALAIVRTELRGYRAAQWAQPVRGATRAIAPLVEWIRRNTPEGTTVLAEGGEVVTLFTGRLAAPPATFTAREYVVPLGPADHRRQLEAMLAAVPAGWVVTLHPGVAAAARTLPSLRQVDSLPGVAMFEVHR